MAAILTLQKFFHLIHSGDFEVQEELDFTPMALRNLPPRQAFRHLLRWWISYGLPDVEPFYKNLNFGHGEKHAYSPAPSFMSHAKWIKKHLSSDTWDYIIGSQSIRYLNEYCALPSVPLVLILPHLHPRVRARCKEVFTRPSRVRFIINHYGARGMIYTAQMNKPEYLLPQYMNGPGMQEIRGYDPVNLERFHGTMWLLRMVNGSPEPDGRYKTYWIRINPVSGGRTENALAISYGVPEGSYGPSIRT